MANYSIENLMEMAVEQGATDLHINPGEAPSLRINTKLDSIEGPILTPQDAWGLIESIASPEQMEELQSGGAVDFPYDFHEKSRFRINAFRRHMNYAMVMRLIPKQIMTLEQLYLPTSIEFLLKQPRGLIFVTGPTGAGKSTTLAAMIDWLNNHREGHIVTIEDPIEYQFEHKRCLISQREIGSDTPTFHRALKDVLRQDPDVILVGEMRDLETIEAAVTAAETGHLVLATLHTTGAARTVDRIIDVFPADAKNHIRTQLSTNLVAVISQVLCPTIDPGLIAAFEIMVNTTAIASLIRENKTFRVTSEMQIGAKHGMTTLDNQLFNLAESGKISPDVALSMAQEPFDLKTRFEKG